MEETTNLKLPLLVSNQSQKEITHNEALVILDNLVNNGVKDKDLTIPPENPSQNDLYIVGVGASGEWEGKDNQLAFYDNGWRFCQARQGTKYWVNDENCIYVFNSTSWTKFSSGSGGTVGGGEGGESGDNTSGATALSQLDDVSLNSISQDDILKFSNGVFTNSKELNNLTGLGINCECDDDNKLVTKSDYVLFDNNGGDSKIKANKSTTTQTASHLFQNNYSGRAEFGLIGNDDFSLKVSSNGSEWKEAFVVDKATGNIDFKGEITKNGESFIDLSNSNQILKSSIPIINNDAFIEFTDLNPNYINKFIIEFKPNLNSNLEMILSNNNGETYANAGYNGSHIGRSWTTGDIASENENNSSSFRLGIFVINNVIYQISNTKYSLIDITIEQNKDNFLYINTISYLNNYHVTSFGGGNNSLLGNSINAIKFFLSSGTFNDGSIKHYILK